MALNAKKAKGGNGGGDRPRQPNIEPGGYPGRLVQLIDLGLQKQRVFEGKEKPPAHMIYLTYELVDEFMIDEDGNPIEDKPRWISEEFPLYNLKSEKARSTQRYKVFDPDIEDDGDWAEQLSKPCIVNIVNNKSGDNVYDNVRDIAPMRPKEAAKCPELVNPTKLFDLSDPDLEVFRSLPEWLQDKIKNNLEYPGSPLEELLKGGSKEAKKGKAKPQEAVEEDDVEEEDGDDSDW